MDIPLFDRAKQSVRGAPEKNAEIPVELGEKSLSLKMCVGRDVNDAFFKVSQ